MSDATIIGIMLMIILAFYLGLLLGIYGIRKSKYYRRILSDLYVTGRIRQIANHRKVNLDLEKDNMIRFLRSLRKDRPNTNIDDTIEEEIKDELSSDLKK